MSNHPIVTRQELIRPQDEVARQRRELPQVNVTKSTASKARRERDPWAICSKPGVSSSCTTLCLPRIETKAVPHFRRKVSKASRFTAPIAMRFS
jgi:hypothetical protein